MINRLTGEPILPARTANQYLANFTGANREPISGWYGCAWRADKIGSPVRRFITYDAEMVSPLSNLLPFP
jgi:hypothetical protein